MNFLPFTMFLLRNSSQRKHVFRWLNSLRKDSLLKYRQPWLVFDAIDFLNTLPLKGKKVFEYGSGGSTLFWLNRGSECISIEHDPAWYNTMLPILSGQHGIDYRLVQPELFDTDELQDISDPRQYLSADILAEGLSFKNYVRQIDLFPDEFFDIVLIDGRARPACIMHSTIKVRIGGYIIVDNSDRDYYFSKTSASLDNFSRQDFSGAAPLYPQWEHTSVFFRLK